MYEKQWTASNPGCLILLVDQSTSMADPFPTLAGRGELKRKCDTLAQIVNEFLSEAIKRCEHNAVVVRRMDIAVLGYGARLGDALQGVTGIASVNDVSAHRRIVKRTDTERDDETGAPYEISVDQSVWLDPVANGNTPMYGIMSRAYLLADAWAHSHQNSFPPVVLNVTDGEATDNDPRQAARQLATISTSDGQTLLFNCHLGNGGEPEVAYPTALSDLRTSNKFAPVLFEMSSVLPENMRIQANAMTGKNIQPNARAMVYNGSMHSVLDMLTIASLPSQAM